MKKNIFLCLLLASLLPVNKLHAQKMNGEDIVTRMHKRYSNNWYRTLSFTQDTEIYRNDSLIRKAVWYEMARFPYELRIDVDSISGGNKVIYKKDSTYRIRQNKLQGITADSNPFIFFLGGMYMLPFDSVKTMLEKNGYDLSKGSSSDWQGRKVFIVGAGNDKDSTSNQFWVDAEHLYIVRVKVKMGNTALDVHMSGHQKLSKGWSESVVKFYRDGKIMQIEYYRDIKPDAKLEEVLFDVSRFR